MNIRVYPARLTGTVEAPPSKSCAHRLLIAAALAEGVTRIQRPGDSQDVAATARCLRALGAEIEGDGRELTVRGDPEALLGPESARLDCGESGSTLRFLLPLAALRRGRTTFTGRGRLPRRPIDTVLSPLAENGAAFARQGGDESLPLTFSGGLRAGEYTLPGNVSSQFFSGLLFALPLLPGDSRIVLSAPLESASYVELTRQALARFSVSSLPVRDGWLVSGDQRYRSPGSAATEGDWSSAAFWLAANALGAEISITGLSNGSAQPDRVIGELLGRLGGIVDVSACPDLMPILAAAAANLPGETTRFTGAARLRLKESDRLAAMGRCIRALGGDAREERDGLTVLGRTLSGGIVDGEGDHRVVMSAAVAACFAQSPTLIRGAEVTDKSYPAFWDALRGLGGRFEEVPDPQGGIA